MKYMSQEVAEGLKRLGWREIPPDLQAIMEEVDSDKSGHIDYTGSPLCIPFVFVFLHALMHLHILCLYSVRCVLAFCLS